MASVSVQRRNKDEGRPATWRVMWREPSGRQRSKTFKRKTDADAHASKIEHQLRESTYLDPTAATMTVGSFAETWIKGQVQLSATSRARYDGVIRNQINPRWEHVPLGKVTHEDVQTWIADLGRGGQAARSVVKAHFLISRILDAAVRAKRIPANPARGAVLPRAEQKAKKFLTHDDVAALAEACEEQSEGLGLIVQALAFTGLRFGELAALRVRDFDAAQRRFQIKRSVTDVNGVMIYGPTKTHSHREVPVTATLAKKITAHIKATGRAGDELLFTSPSGTVLRSNNFRRRGFDAAAAAVGLEGLVPHELRHTAASLAVNAGADVKAVQRMLGHASAAMTLDVYSTLFERGLDEVADRMDRAATKAAKDRAKRVAAAV